MSAFSHDRPASRVGQEDVPSDLLLSPSEVYHENSKLHPGDIALYSWMKFVNSSPTVRRLISRPVSRYRGYPVVPLPEETPDSDDTLARVLLDRRSARTFSGEPIPLSTLGRILRLGDGVAAEQSGDDGTVWGLRTAPSGGALYPIDLYCAVMRVDGLAPGLYSYDMARHQLQLLRPEDPTEALAECTALGSAIRQAAVCIVMGALFRRSKFKYGERSYRFVLLEAGHIGQNLLLAAESAGLAAVPVGGFMDDPMNALLRFDGVEEAAVYAVVMGGRLTLESTDAYNENESAQGGQPMTQTIEKRDYRDLFIDPDTIRRVVAETNARMGFVPKSTMSAEELQELMIAEGVRPEECLGSRGIIEERYGTSEQPEEAS